jgi:hypothetical protein
MIMDLQINFKTLLVLVVIILSNGSKTQQLNNDLKKPCQLQNVQLATVSYETELE